MTKYGIKVNFDGGYLWMQHLSEYTSNKDSIMTYNTRGEAEEAAQAMELKKYIIEEIK